MIRFRGIILSLFEWDFTEEMIDRVVRRNSLGNYLLGNREKGSFVARFVGRSDIDLNAELKRRLDSSHKKFDLAPEKRSKI